jgi:hypothetical protein
MRSNEDERQRIKAEYMLKDLEPKLGVSQRGACHC